MQKVETRVETEHSQMSFIICQLEIHAYIIHVTNRRGWSFNTSFSGNLEARAHNKGGFHKTCDFKFSKPYCEFSNNRI